mmetsp:Transcript_63613/g.138561  ORF Transcript_63613/g.138561 Transcript_63613/m.138561 type:complete len:205 (-) Transcript_63613:147-761(-)
MGRGPCDGQVGDGAAASTALARRRAKDAGAKYPMPHKNEAALQRESVLRSHAPLPQEGRAVPSRQEPPSSLRRTPSSSGAAWQRDSHGNGAGLSSFPAVPGMHSGKVGQRCAEPRCTRQGNELQPWAPRQGHRGLQVQPARLQSLATATTAGGWLAAAERSIPPEVARLGACGPNPAAAPRHRLPRHQHLSFASHLASRLMDRS